MDQYYFIVITMDNKFLLEKTKSKTYCLPSIIDDMDLSKSELVKLISIKLGIDIRVAKAGINLKKNILCSAPIISNEICLSSAYDLFHLEHIESICAKDSYSILSIDKVKNFIALCLVENITKYNFNASYHEINYIKDFYTGRGFTEAYFVNPKISLMMAKLLNAHNGKLLDPCCGSGRLLEHIDSDVQVDCFEIDPNNAKVAKALYKKANIVIDDVLIHKEKLANKYEFFIANPPWGLKVNRADYFIPRAINSNISSLYFLELCLLSLKDKGRGIIFFSLNILDSDQKRILYDQILIHANILLEIDLPQEELINTDGNCKIILLQKKIEKQAMIP
jgi:SAM-dependent methyltransferase